MTSLRVILTGGGTGGHVFPAIAIAQEIRRRYPEAEFLFIGAQDKMEMEAVPREGFAIKGLDIAGFDRGKKWANLKLIFKLVSSARRSRKIIKDFAPDLVIGTGGYASAPALLSASRLGIPVFIQEQNSLPGMVNQFLSRKAKAVFTAYPGMEGFFPKTKTYFLGNPIREDLVSGLIPSEVAKERMGLQKDKLTVLSLGGSLGSKTLNNAWLENLERLLEGDLQLIWQTGSLDHSRIEQELGSRFCENIHLREFISDMSLAYSAADLIVSRAGAIAISELCIVGKPVLLVPFPFSAQDHQTKNALVLSQGLAAIMLRDSEVKTMFWDVFSDIVNNKGDVRTKMSENIKLFSKPHATRNIVDKIFEILKR